MRVEWIVLAEGFGTSSNGAVTAIGVNQRVVIAPSLPATTKRGVIAHFSSDAQTVLEQEIEVSLSVASPSGHPIVAITSPARMNPGMSWPDVPAGVDIFLEVPLRLAEYGEYAVSLSLTPPGGERVTGCVPLYVKEGPALPITTSASPQINQPPGSPPSSS